MREILFRGKRVELICGKIVFGDWVYGYYYDNNSPSLLVNGKHINAEYILVQDSYGDVPSLGNLGSPRFFQVLPETVGQFTGLTDKNGRKIFEGDIVQHGWGKYSVTNEVVEWDENSCGFEPFSDSRNNCGHCGGGVDPSIEDCYVIGNVHDNPELLEVKK